MKQLTYLFLALLLSFSNACSTKEDCTSPTKTAPASEVTALEAYLTTNGITATKDSRGFYYNITVPGGSAKPTICSTISVKCTGRLQNGTIFDSSNGATFNLSQLIVGWQQGIPYIGKGGKIDWTRVGLDSNKVYATIKNYRINLNDGELVADSSSFFNFDISAKPMLGKVTDRPMGKSQGEKSIYPQFDGYFSAFTGASYGKAKFKGGFGMRGALVIGKGTSTQKAELWFTFKNKPFMRVQSPEFFVRENRISVEKAEVTIFLDKDSIYHPQLAFNYLIDKDKV
ncbi:MAG: hypothetical protein FGM54_09145, partial [Chitinophagaceae bacterium]|nr:hypothetical protein [Chitinophagaceae bacterium]